MDMKFYKQSLKEYGHRLKVLYAEDEVETREVMLEMLSRYFNHIVTAVDGKEAFELYQSESFDIVISDISMPRMNGMELAKAIRSINETQPIIIISAHNDAHYLFELINLGVSAFIIKPIETDLLFKTLYGVSKSLNDAFMLNAYYEELLATNTELEKLNGFLQNEYKKETLRSAFNASVSNELETKNPIIEEPIHEPVVTKESLRDYHDNLLTEDIHEMKDLVDDIENYVLLTLQPENLNTQYLAALADCFRKFGSILCRYHFFTALSMGLFDLARGVEEREDAFIKEQAFVAPFLENLIYVLHSYIEEVWIKSSENPNFYDASILNDIATFLAIVENRQEAVTSQPEDLLEFF